MELAVSDNGIGIPARYQQRVFEVFSKLSNSAGTGIGLAVVARIAELHGGSVTVESDGSSGTTFRVRVPSAQPIPDQAADLRERATKRTARAFPLRVRDQRKVN